jgi:biotin operon repressor
MDFITYSERLDYLLELIYKGNTSSPKQIAQKFGCCEKTARNMVNSLRQKGYPIKYDRQTAKYFIENSSR